MITSNKTIVFFYFFLLGSILLLPSSSWGKVFLSRNRDWKIPGVYLSPDRRYKLLATVGDGEVVRLRVIGVRSHLKEKRFSFIQGFRWIPDKPHSLIFAVATDNDGEDPGIFLWDSQNRLITILKPTIGYESFSLIGVDNQHRIIYEYYPNLLNKNNKTRGPFIKRVRLPK